MPASALCFPRYFQHLCPRQPNWRATTGAVPCQQLFKMTGSYGYVKADTGFGVARMAIGGSPSSVLVATSDENYNHAGFAFALEGNTPVFGTVFLSQVGRTLKVVKGS